ncbi:diguanylate cyclase/phosphodiesterase [Halalkalibacter wakoensis JCM 9140]|uniref:Diguanylate cyclase/phosphodiesterase n=1 Tax=Halalkalibacter wakoensis JCM 9140 TaxID=1236970 RepID=W4Q3M1_9BACI|nr:EAL domain-containing protein [Halalkalibacter wakoensis]GAE26323.1 diguanylate cyclase/phosphodiesterase [Halalkalibacter wakoensis JCM 9140]
MLSIQKNAKNVEALIKAADVALYQAKLIGSDTYNLYKHEMRLDIHEKFHIENDLRRALEKNEFSLLFQPQYHIATNQYCGEEVLVRWDHPLEGLISPDRFITIAEETGLITSIGKWVLQQACLQKKIWIEKGLPEVPISVNLSLRQFLQQSIVEMVAEVLEESELPPHLLKIEVTESVMIDLDRTSTVVKQLLALGVKISLDDFGTGYSSLQYINQLPVHELKIDQTFVAGIGKGKQAEEIISMIIQLAHSLSISVVAEGVETKEQLLYLTQNNCHKIQGYYYSKPLTGNDFELFMNGLQ